MMEIKMPSLPTAQPEMPNPAQALSQPLTTQGSTFGAELQSSNEQQLPANFSALMNQLVGDPATASVPGGMVPTSAPINAATDSMLAFDGVPTQAGNAQRKVQIPQSLDRKDPRGFIPQRSEGGIQDLPATRVQSDRSSDLDISNAAYMNMLASQGMSTGMVATSVRPMVASDAAVSSDSVMPRSGQSQRERNTVVGSKVEPMVQPKASALAPTLMSTKPIMTAEYVFDSGEASSLQQYMDKSLWNQSDLSVAERLRAMTPHLYQNVAHQASRPVTGSDAVMVLEPAAVMINATPLYALRSVSDVGAKPGVLPKGFVPSARDNKLSLNDMSPVGRMGLVDVGQLFPELTTEDVQLSELGYDYLANSQDAAPHAYLNHPTSPNTNTGSDAGVLVESARAFVASEKLDLNAPTPQQNAVVLSAVRQAISRNTDSVRIKLNPENLGEVEVKLSKVGNTLSLEFQTSSLAARDVLSGSIGELKSGLEKSNYVLGDVRVEAKAVAKSTFEQFNTDFGNVFARDFLETRTQLGQSTTSRDGEWRDDPQQNYYADRDSSQQQRNDRRYRLYEEWNA